MVASAAPHGGLQQSLDVHPGADERLVVETTYGLLRVGEDGTWSWVCEEISGTESAWHFGTNETGHWILSGVDRVFWSDDQCDWQEVTGDIENRYITAILADPSDADVFWTVTASGAEENALFQSIDGGRSFSRQSTFEDGARLRDIAIHPDGTTWVVGWRDDLPWLWASTDREEWIEILLDEDTYSVSLAGLDPDDPETAWVRLITATGDRLVRARQDGTTEVRLDTPEAIEAFLVLPESGHLLLGGRDAGLYRSTDSGLTWTGPHQSPEPGCLRVFDEQLYVCGNNWTDGSALLRTPVSIEDPESWVWEPILSFGEVRRVHDCPEDSRTAEYCDELWDEVVLEAGFDRDIGDSGDEGGTADSGSDASRCSCSQRAPFDSSGLLIGCGLLWLRRRRE